MATKDNALRERTLVTGVIKREGSEVLVPKGMTLENAIKVIQTTLDREELIVQKVVELDADPLESAYAASKAIEKICGTVLGKPLYSFFGTNHPKEITVQVSPTETVTVPWGTLVFPFDPEEGSFTIGARDFGNRYVGFLSVQMRGKFSGIWEQIVHEANRILREEPLYKSRCLRMSFLDSDGDLRQFPEVKPWDVQHASVQTLIFSEDLEASIEDHIFTPIRHMEACAASGIPFKRGVLLAGDYGTGKTELAAAVAAEASRRGITVVYIEDVKELAEAIRFASRQAPAIVFAEDVDRMTDGERSHDIDRVLNTLDGIDTKQFPVMTILTTNYPKKIYKGMIRPGRIDVALAIETPDAAAVVKLVKMFLGEKFNDEGDMTALGQSMEGYIPAVIHEVCRRSTLSYISRTGKVPIANSITVDDVLRAGASMSNQIALLNDRDVGQHKMSIKRLA